MMTAEEAFRKAVRIVARADRLRVADIVEPRSRAARRSRGMALYIAVVVGNVRVAQVARVARMHHSSVGYMVQRLEEHRDGNSAFDAVLTRLEEGLTHAV